MKFENKVLPNEQQLKGFDDNPEIGPIKMLNLVKLKKHAEYSCLLYTSPSPRDQEASRMPSSA